MKNHLLLTKFNKAIIAYIALHITPAILFFYYKLCYDFNLPLV